MRTMLAAVMVLALVAGSAQAEMFSFNLASKGKPTSSIWVDPTNGATNMATVTIEQGETAGVWPTDVWDNVRVDLMSTATINGSEGSTATFKVITKRNQGPYNWTTLRDGSTAVSPANEAYMNNGNATLLDAHLNATEKNNAGDTFPTPAYNAVIEVTGLSFSEYDVIIYLGVNSAQAGNRKGFINFNGGGLTSFTIPAGQPSTTLDQVESDGDTGNYILYQGLTSSSFTATVYGEGYNHLGPAGIQILEVPEPATMSLLALGGLAMLRRRRACPRS